MSNLDLTRFLPPASRHISGARLQQGRALLDTDFNEAAEARALLARDTVLSIVGPLASPDDGFLPDLSAGQTLTATTVTLGSFFEVFVTDWALGPGTVYVGGLRFTQDELEPVVFQRDYLQMGPGTAPRAAVGRYRQLAVLHGWEQSVTAVEDGELTEAATGGADTTTRIHRRKRVEVYLVNGETCADAFAEVLDEIAEPGAIYDAATASLRSNARLQIRFVSEANDECPACRPRLAGRYLGSEAHAVRIMLATPTSYVWALDTSPLYRVKLVMEGSGVARIEFLTPPKDKFLEPRHGAVVELLPWASLLRNGTPQSGKIFGQTVVNEKVSTLVGFFSEAIAPYDAATRSLRVRLSNETLNKIGITQAKGQPAADTAAQEALKTGEPPTEDVIALQWDARHPCAGELSQPSGGSGFTASLYMRVWHTKGDDSVLLVPTAAPKPLGRTGLVPHFSGAGIAGDTWTVAVSPLRNDVVLPLDLLQAGGVPPHGPQRVLAPLALIEWDSPFGLTHRVVSVTDCRPSLPRVTDRGCCTVWVGPGDEGDTDSIQDAVHRLPASGGRICILPGTYREEVRVFGRRNVTIEGCGPGSEIVSPAEPSLPGVFSVEPVGGIAAVTIRRLSIAASGQAGVHATGRGIEIHAASVHCEPGRGGTPARSTVVILDGSDLRITGCRLSLASATSPHAALYVECPGGDALVEGNTVEALEGEGSASAWGGIHVAGGSRGVEIRGNRIAGGYGSGITFGSVTFRARNGDVRRHEGAGVGQSDEDPPAATGRPVPVAFEPSETDPVARDFFPEPDAEITEVLVADNHIEGTGGSGIASLAIRVDHREEAVGAPLCMRERMFRVRNLSIRDNVIARCAARPPAEPALPWVAGGIALSAVVDLAVRGNTIAGCGAAADVPACGIYLAQGLRIEIRSNRLRANGPRIVASRATALGGGIVLSAPEFFDVANAGATDPRIDTVCVAGNVVEQPDGAALVLVGTGPAIITANHLETGGSSGSLTLPGVTTVLVALLGPPAEAVDIPPNEPDPQRWRQPVGSQEFLAARAQTLFGDRGGGALLSGNTVVSHRRDEGPNDVASGRVALLALSTDAVTVVSNTVALRGGRAGFFADALLVGATAAASANAFTETVGATDCSLAVAAPMLALGAENTATHCVVVYGGPNDGNPDYEESRDNLVLLRPLEGGCAIVAGNLRDPLAGLIARLFDLGAPGNLGPQDLVNRFTFAPRGGGQ